MLFRVNNVYDHLVNPKRQIIKVIVMSDVPFAFHDLCRTFITMAESLDNFIYARKCLVNHKFSNDITAGKSFPMLRSYDTLYSALPIPY